MKYAVWFFRFLFAAWMIPAGINHFYLIFPQPMGSQPLSQELIVALLDSHLFDLVKAVELIAGVGVLFGFYTPLMLLICLPVSFNVFYWDAPLEGWSSRAALFGEATLLCTVLLMLAYFKAYRPMLTLRAQVKTNAQLVMIGRVAFGAAMVIHSVNYLFLSLWSMPAGAEPLAAQLMTSLMNSRLLDVAMAIQLVTGALILAGVLVPAALALLMPISTCALYWALVLNHEPLTAVLALAAFAINGLLMLAYMPYYRGMLQRHTLALGEGAGEDMHYDTLFVNPNGYTSRAAYVPALIPLLAALAFFAYMVGGRTAHFCMLMLMYPTFVLLARRMHGMGTPGPVLIVPTALVLVAFAVKLGYMSVSESVDGFMPWIALVVTGAFALWGCTKK